MKKRVLAIIVALIVLVFVGCSSKMSGSTATKPGSRSASNAAVPASTGTPAPNADYSSSDNKAAEGSDMAASNVQDERKVIYNANVTLEVKDLNAAYNTIAQKTDGMGGYIVNSSLTEYSSRLTAKIPAEMLNEFLGFLDSVGEKKTSATSASDITDEYTDVDSRLRNLKAQEEQILAIMKKAVTIEEILQVQNELSRVRGEIEALQGRLNMWDRLVEMSTIIIELNKKQEIGGKDVKPSFVSWGEIGRGISNGFTSTLNFVVRFFSGLIIFLISAIPVMPFIALIIWIVLRYRKKIKRNTGR